MRLTPIKMRVLKVETRTSWTNQLAASGEVKPAGEPSCGFYTDDPAVAARLVAAKPGDELEIEAVRDLDNDLILVGRFA